MPNQLNDQSKNLHSILQKSKDFVQDNSVLAVEVPTLECVDSKAYEKFANDDNPLYHYRDKYPDLYVNVDDVRDHVINCCKSTMCTIREAHDLERHKATEVLLFLLSDTDREYSKDKPAAVPVAYALKGKSLKVSTAQQMVTDVRDFLHNHDINVLVEAYNGQWADLVFRNHNDKPLTLFELQRDCWPKICKMAKDKLITFLEGISRNKQCDLDALSQQQFSQAGTSCVGNIRTHLGWHNDTSQSSEHNILCKTYLAVESFCNDFNCEGGIGMVTFPTVEVQPDLWEVRLSDRNLLHTLSQKEFSPGMSSVHGLMAEDSVSNNDDADVQLEMYHSHPLMFNSNDSTSIRSLLLSTHKSICTEIIFLLLCGKGERKWTSLTVESLLDDILSSAENIFKKLTSCEIDGILCILQ